MLNSKNKPPMDCPEASGKPFWRRKWLRWGSMLLLAFLPWLLSAASMVKAQAQPQAADTRPNIVFLVADDAGYADFGAFGGEAATPNIDAFAAAGMKLTNYHTMPTCSPSRSVLLTGVVNHLNGFGTMAGNLTHNPLHAQTGQPGYLAHLNDHVVTVATLLKDAGYHTYHVGKWHLAEEEEGAGGQTIFLRGTWPIDQGFEKSYGMLDGGSEHFGRLARFEGGNTTFIENDTIISGQLPPDYFSGQAHTDKALEYIDAGQASDGGQRKPFFLYYADTMPHEPNQVPDEFIKQSYIDLYYTQGWDAMRADRLQRMKDLNLIPAAAVLPPRFFGVPDWNNVNDPAWGPLMAQVTTPPYNVMWQINTVDDLKRTLAKKYAVYTGMVEYFDTQVGRLTQHLKDIGEYDNTVFIFVSDNGGDAVPWDFDDRNFMLSFGIDNSYANIGRRNSFTSNGLGWAQVSNVPFDGAKAAMYEGGVRVPLIIAYPNGAIASGAQSGALVTGADVAATILDYASVAHPVGTGAAPNWVACTGAYQGQTSVCPMNGKSLRGVVEGATAKIHEGEPIAYELFGNTNKALLVEEGNDLWKIRKVGDFGLGRRANEPWKLFNLATDLREQQDLSAANPAKLQQLIALYNQYEYNVGFVATAGQAKKNTIAGTTVAYTFVVTNTSPIADSFSIVCQSAWPCTIVTPSNVQLAAGQATPVQFTISIPVNAARGASNTTQLNALTVTRPAFSKNFTAVTVSGGPPPVANSDSYSTNEDTALTVPAPGVLGNDTDAENDVLSAVLVSGPAHGTLTLNSNGSFSYLPAANYSGSDSFTYKANDGHADSAVATVNLTVVSAASQITQLGTNVQALISSRALTGSNGQALLNKLDSAQKQLAKGNIAATITKLQEFIAQVNDYIASGKLTAAQGQPLIAAANAAIYSLGGTVTSADADIDDNAPNRIFLPLVGR